MVCPLHTLDDVIYCYQPKIMETLDKRGWRVYSRNPDSVLLSVKLGPVKDFLPDEDYVTLPKVPDPTDYAQMEYAVAEIIKQKKEIPQRMPFIEGKDARFSIQQWYIDGDGRVLFGEEKSDGQIAVGSLYIPDFASAMDSVPEFYWPLD